MATRIDDLLFRIKVRKDASANASVNRFLAQIKQIQNALNKTTSAQKRLTSAQRTAQSVMSKLKRGISSTVGALGGFLILRRITRLMTEFETRIAEMSTVISGSQAKVEGMRREIVQLSREVPQSAAELGAAAYQIFSAQILDSADALFVLRNAAKAAVAGLTNTETATVALVSVLNAFRMEASEAERVADVLFRTVELGLIKFAQIAKEIGTATTSAALAGVTLEELAAAIATITLRGIPAAETTTSLNRLFIALTRQTKAQKDAFRAMGIEFSVAAVKERGFISVIEEINKLTAGQIDRLSELFPNIRAARAAFVLAGTGVEQYRIALERMQDTTGAAQRAFLKVANTSTNAAKLLKNNFNATLLELSESILPGAVKAFGFLIDVLDRLRFRSLQSPQFVASIETLSDILTEDLTPKKPGEAVFPAIPFEQRKEIAADLAKAMNNLIGLNDAFGLSLSRQMFNMIGMSNALKNLRDDELVAIRKGAESLFLLGSGVPESIVREHLTRQLEAIAAEIQRRPELARFLREGGNINARPDVPGPEDLLESAAEQLERRIMLARELARRIDQLTRTSAEQQIAAITLLREKYIAEYEGRIPEAAEEGFRRIGNAARAALREEQAKELAQRFRDEFEKGLTDIDIELFTTIADENERGIVSLERQLVLLEEVRQKVVRRLQSEENTREENEALRKVLVEILRLIDAARRSQTAVANEAERTAKARFRELQLQLSLIRQTIDGVIELANAFGLVDDETAKVLRNLEQMGIGAATLVGGISTGDPAGIAAGITSLAGGLAGLGAALFGGESEEARRLRETMEDNIRAIELLTESMSAQVQAFNTFTRREIGRARQLAIGGALAGTPRLVQFFLDSLSGEDLDLLERIAQTLDVTLDGTRQSFEALKEAIDALDISRLTEDFNFAMSALQRRFDIFDVDDPLEQLEMLVEAMRDFGAIIPLGGLFDPSTAEGRRALDDFIKRVFESTLAGDFPIPQGMSLEQWLAFLANVEDLLDQISGEAGDTQQFAISRTITEITGSRMAALLFGIQFETTRIADNSDIMVQLLNIMAGTPAMTAPAMSAVDINGRPIGNGDGMTISVGGIDIDVIISGSVDRDNAAEIGQKVGDNVLAQIDRGLGERVREAARLAGEVILS